MQGIKGILKILLSRFKQIIRYDPVVSEFKDGTSNTALLNYNRSVFALVESNLPLEISVDPERGVISTVEYFDFEQQLKHSFTAHPKVDSSTGELIFFGYNVKNNPYLNYAVADHNSNILTRMTIDLPRPIMMHDFCITQNYSIICDMPLIFDPKRIANDSFVFYFDNHIPARYGVFPRHC